MTTAFGGRVSTVDDFHQIGAAAHVTDSKGRDIGHDRSISQTTERYRLDFRRFGWSLSLTSIPAINTARGIFSYFRLARMVYGAHSRWAICRSGLVARLLPIQNFDERHDHSANAVRCKKVSAAPPKCSK
jgi:hypothetical protein